MKGLINGPTRCNYTVLLAFLVRILFFIFLKTQRDQPNLINKLIKINYSQAKRASTQNQVKEANTCVAPDKRVLSCK